MKRVVCFLTSALFLAFSELFAQPLDTTFTVYGPRRFERSTGSPVTVTETFTIPPTAASPYKLYIINGEVDGDDRVSSATLKVNGVLVLDQNDLNQRVAFLTRSVNLGTQNSIEVRLASQPKSFLIIGIMATDQTPPRLTVITPPQNLITNALSVTVSGTVFDETRVNLKVNEIAVPVDSLGNFTTEMMLAEGLNVITVEATDAAGNVRRETVEVRRDTQLPIVDLRLPIDDFITSQSSVEVGGTVADSTAVTLTVNDVAVEVQADGSFTTMTPLIEGLNQITVVATDAAGNERRETREVRRDTEAPIVDWRLPIADFITKDTVVVVSGTVVDSTAVTLMVNGDTVAVGAGGAFSYPLSAVEGINTITVVATDAAENSSTATRLVIRDSTPPTLVVSQPVGRVFTSQTMFAVAGSIADSTALTVTINGDQQTLTPAGEFSTQVALVEGLNIVMIVATDAAGNSSSATREIIRDTTPPTLTVTEPAGGRSPAAQLSPSVGQSLTPQPSR